MTGRVLGLDYGRRRIGVAVSDPLGITAQPLTTWEGGVGEAVELVCRTVRELEIGRIVVGWPLTLRGEKGRMAAEVERFIDRIRERCDVPVVLWDERLTSKQARRVMHETHGNTREKGRIDRIASALLLQNYLDSTETMKRHEETSD